MTFKSRVQHALQTADVVLCFDRYYEKSIKTAIRNERSKSRRIHKLNPQMDAPKKKKSA